MLSAHPLQTLQPPLPPDTRSASAEGAAGMSVSGMPGVMRSRLFKLVTRWLLSGAIVATRKLRRPCWEKLRL